MEHKALYTRKLIIRQLTWRREWDSNPRYPFGHGSFQDCYLQPLGHLSLDLSDYTTYCYGRAYRVSIYAMRDTQRKGDIAVAQAIASFTRLNFDVALPITESAAYDLVVDDDGVMRRVQVRYCGNGEVELRRIHSNSAGYVIKKTSQNAYDWLYILDVNHREYLIKACLDGRRSIRPKATQLLESVLGIHAS
jgi:hypothetical protein